MGQKTELCNSMGLQILSCLLSRKPNTKTQISNISGMEGCDFPYFIFLTCDTLEHYKYLIPILNSFLKALLLFVNSNFPALGEDW